MHLTKSSTASKRSWPPRGLVSKARLVLENPIDFIVPTLKRPEHLERCLVAISRLDNCRPRALVGVRSDDLLSREVIDRLDGVLDIEPTEARGVGVVGSMNSCLRACEADCIALVDDDVELPPNWADKMLSHLRENVDVVGVSGRDLLMDHPEMRRTEPLVENVGRIHWFGRITGDHHRGGGDPRRVDILRGSNCLYRAGFLQKHGFERSLAGKGAQVNWELALGLQAMGNGVGLLFDPTVHVLHHVAPRQDNDSVHRGVFDQQGTSDIAHNETLVVLKHGRGWLRMAMLLWQLVVGSRVCPGVLRLLQRLTSDPEQFWQRCAATLQGRWAALSTLWQGTHHAD